MTEKRHLVEEVYISDPDHIPLLSQLAEDVSILEISPQQMHQVSQMTTPPGVLAICHLPIESVIPDNLSGKKIFYLEAIRDPGNLGTILRIADWFGLDLVLLSPDCVDIYNYKVLQASMGSALRVTTLEVDKTVLLTIAAGNLYICDTEGTNINSLAPPEDGILVLGNESLGVSDDLFHQVKDILAIPGHHSLGAESLNVAAAAAILANWWRK